jgi:hypothetical protein
MMTKRISLPSDSQVMSNQAFPVIAATQTALAMTTAALRCEHINLDDLHLYLAGKKRSNKSDWMAYDIIDAAEKLIALLSDYRTTVNTEIRKLKNAADLPF